MQKDFHYNMTLALAIKAGFDKYDAMDIAWSNQFTDECKDFDKYGIRTMVDITWKASDCFIPEVQRSVFVPFHFLPGGNNLFPFIVTQASGLAYHLISEAEKVHDIIRFGIALHSFQDTYSHQGFSGMQDDNNAKHPWDKTGLSSLAPRIGHAEFGHDPDIMNRIWTGPSGGVMNYTRFQAAALETFKILLRFKGEVLELDKSIKRVNEIEKELADFWSITHYDSRKKWLQAKSGLGRYSEYKPTQEQIKRFVAAARKQQAIVLDYLS